jgi:hypothetical protein
MIVSETPNRSRSRWLEACVLLCAVVLLPLGLAYGQDYDAVAKRLGQGVEAGELTQQQADAMMAALKAVGTAEPKNLGDVLRESGWDRIIGTWVDAETNGAKCKSTITWRFKDRVVEISSRDGETESLSIMGLEPKSGSVFNMSVDSEGTSSLGRWRFEEATAILEFAFVTAAGQDGGLRILCMLQNDDTMIVTIDLPEPMVFKMIRVKESGKLP